MQQIVTLAAVISLNQVILSKPINNGFTLKFNPISPKEDVKPKTFGTLFAKIPQESTRTANIRREILSEAYFQHSSELGTGCTNQITKIFFPFKSTHENNSLLFNANYINIPIIQQPFANYKIIVATAPPNIKISGTQAEPLVLYVVFPDGEASDAQSINIPSIYFVKSPRGLPFWNKQPKVDPVLIIDSNRTVTGIKSKEVAKFVKFKNKLRSRYNYEVERR